MICPKCGCEVDGMELACAGCLSDSELNQPFDAPNRRAHFERTDRYNAFHDGLNTPEIQAAIAKARDNALAKMKARKAHTWT